MSTLQEVISNAENLSPQERLRLIVRLCETLPPDYWPNADDDDLIAARRQLLERDTSWMEPVPWPIVERLLTQRIRSRRPKIYAVPRRFDLATILIVTLAYSILFALMTTLQFPSFVSIAVAGFITFVGLAQAALFGGKRPLAASIWVGAAIYTIAMLAGWLATGARAYDASTILIVGSYVIIGGAVLGYMAGACVGGVFLLADVLRRKFSKGNRLITAHDSDSCVRADFDSNLSIIDSPIYGGIWEFLFDTRDNSKLHSAPRQFDLASIFIITGVYSLLFGGLSLIDRELNSQLQPGLTIVVGGVITSVAIAQAWFYQKANPRGVSVLAGAISYSVICLVLWFVYPRSFPGSWILVLVINGIIGGAFLGYLTGAMVGGMFLVADVLRKRISPGITRGSPPREASESIAESTTVS
jgi:hypothetical protein